MYLIWRKGDENFMEFWLKKDDKDKFQFPVNPSEFTVTVSNKNTTVNVLNIGDVNLIGNTGLREITLSSFFPTQDYNFSNNADRKKPTVYVKQIETWRKSGEPIRVIITSGILNMLCTIESFSYSEQDATGDIYFTIALKEYKKIKVRNVVKKKNVGVATSYTSTRAVQTTNANSGTTYTVKAGDCLSKIARQFYGDGSKYMKIFNANTDKLTDPNKIGIGQVLVIP